MSIDPTKKAKAVEMHLEGKKQKDIAKIVYPDQTPQAGQVSVSRLLNSQEVQAQVAQSLAKHDITIDKAIAPIKEALEATKVVITGSKDDAFAEVIPDHNIRLKAGKEARDLLGINQTRNTQDTQQGMTAEDIQDLGNASNEVELQRILFKKDNDPFK